MKQPLVSVIIPCYNKSEFVGEAIRSVLNQTYTHREIIAVDDGSTDGTWDVIQSFGDQVVALQQANRGTAAARQLALEHASGELIGLLDHDDRWLPYKLERQVPLFDDPEVAIVTGPYYVMDEAGQRLRLAEAPRRDAFEVHAWKVENHIGTVNTLFRREAALAVGGFDVTIRGCDDWDLWIRLADRYRVACLDEPLAEYRSYQGQLSRNGEVMYRNRLLVLRKYRRMHPGCRHCEEAYHAGMARARAKLRAYAGTLCAAGFHAYESGRYGEAWRHYVRAIRAWPALLRDASLLRVLASLAKRSITGYNRQG
jgi:glycosyltransferase involved in cell wall biosynthesis